MKFVIITHVPHINYKNNYFAYAPYVREMNIWSNFCDELIIVAPIQKGQVTAIDCSYDQSNINFLKIEEINLLSFKSICKTILKSPRISWQIFKAMQQADHVHLRCPGNIGLLGCIVQILFPYKQKSAKYAGNWDPKSKQPWTYRLQKWILNNTFLTKNIKVLVYGEWEGSSKNIKSFFTATYGEADKMSMKVLNLKGKINFVFVGTLVFGKNPLYAIQLVERLFKKGYNVSLDLYGEGIEQKALEHYIVCNKLEKIIILRSNQIQETVKKAYQDSHFVVLPSNSEGWPKAIAEGMFWGCVPIATAISCVPFMLDYGTRGILIEMNLEKDIQLLESVLNNETNFNFKREKALAWSQKYTLDVFEAEIEILLNT